MRRYIGIIGIIGILGLSACKPSQPSQYRGLPKAYDLAYEEIYGHCYDSIPYAVVALDLYSEGLSLDQNHRIRGTGYNLYLSDIFVSDSLLEAGTYYSDTTAVPFTFLPGRDYEGLPHGMYLLNIEEDKIVGIQVLDSGLMVVNDTIDGLKSLHFTLYYKNTYGQKATYNTHFFGTLLPWQKK
ncbi:MAG: hypothetical protein J6T80_02395 [Paludibacteraceae bacterium]|nr:hypothetical protein [Paludibacteraceae bacterium]